MLPLSEQDYQLLERCYISRELADAAGIARVDSLEGRERMGRKGAGDYNGQLYSYRFPGVPGVVAERLRLDHPPVDVRGKPEHKYLSPPGQRNYMYFPPRTHPAWLADPAVPLVISEGEKKILALARAAEEARQLFAGNGMDAPPFLPLGFAGVWSWRGRIGARTTATGERAEEHGVIPDFDKLVWKGRRVTICFDTNVLTNDSVRAARAQLARELESRGATVYFLNLPGAEEGINGVDDFLARHGLQPFLELYQHALRHRWHDELMRSEKGKIQNSLDNALLALRLAPEWQGVLAYNQFAHRVEMHSLPPWAATLIKPGSLPAEWIDYDDTMLIAWLERQGIRAGERYAGLAAQAAARENSYHPVRQYLEALKWDGTKRIDDWLNLYCGAPTTDYVRAIGARWLISAVARVFQPGVKVDHVLILEGPQGLGKSMVFEILGGEFYSGDIPDLGSKDSQLLVASAWIIELAELDAIGRTEVSRTKRFLSETHDRFRPPYGRHPVWVPRQCVFGGSINQDTYLKDETGGRRFWPVACGARLHLESLRTHRDHLWAEALVRYRAGEAWWLNTQPLIEEALAEQEKRYQTDPWEGPVETWLINQAEVTTDDVLRIALKKDVGDLTRADQMRVGAILNRLGWRVTKRESSGKRRRIYQLENPKQEEQPYGASKDAGA